MADRDDILNQIDEIDTALEHLDAQIDNLRAAAEHLPDTPAGPRTILTGPRFPPGVDRPTDQQLHNALGVERVRHKSQGTQTLHAPNTTTLGVLTPGGQYKTNKFKAWFPTDPAPDITVQFTLAFPNHKGRPFDFGWQSKTGIGVTANPSGKAWPGGATLHRPDHFIRLTWNDYGRRRAAKGLPPRWCIYAYTPDELAHDGWSTPATAGDGRRTLIAINDAPGPQPEGTYDIDYRLHPVNGETIMDLNIGGVQVWSGSLGSLTPTTAVVLNQQYGGRKADEGPAHDSMIEISGVNVTAAA